MEFLRSFLRLHFAVKPEVASQNVGCFLRHDTQVLFKRGFRFRSKAERPKTRRSAADPEAYPPHSIKTFATQSTGLTIGNPVNFVFGSV